MDTMIHSPPFNRPEDSLTPTAAHFAIPARPEVDSIPLLETPTRDTFSLSEKRPLPNDSAAPAPASLAPPSTTSDPSRPTSQRSGQSSGDADVNMVEGEEEEQDESDNESILEEGQPAKKKRSQRFFCTDYPPCQLSFTRSEHLARHIRKHTGERPFQCHCLRRFSRLDNLRQHAQTVHINEEIPGDSLAATGTRFQRQIRTDRIRPAGHRQRTSTMSSGGSQSRGHSRNLSTSSVGSISDFGSPEDVRRRPQSLAMAQTTPPRPGLSLDTYGTQMGAPPYYNYSPSGYSTPSAMSAEPGSPRVPSGLGSPIAMMPRSTIGWGGQNHSRRLSVPSSGNPFHSPHAFHSPPGAFMSPPPPSSAMSYTNAGSVYTSPTGSNFGDGRRDSIDAVEAEWRRRTWHPSTRNSLESRPATSGLSYHQRPDDPSPMSTTQPAAQQAVRLPGIDSFDRAHILPAAPPRRSQGDLETDEVSLPGETESPSKRDSWASINSNLNHLELIQGSPSDDHGLRRVDSASHPAPRASPMTAQQEPVTSRAVPAPLVLAQNKDIPPMPTDVPITPRNKKRQGWYMGPLNATPVEEKAPGPAVRTSPEGSSNSDELRTPSTNATEYRPAIVHSNGYIEGQASSVLDDVQKTHIPARPDVPGIPSSAGMMAMPENQAVRRSGDTDRLDALVAVATSEDRVITQ